jgi:ParB/RepB/Spo0J family partition protein
MTTQVATKPLNWLKPDPKQPRKFFDEAELNRLGDDMLARGVLVPLLARPDGTLIDGERRWRAAQAKGIKELPVIVTEKPLSDKEVRGIQLATAFHRADLSGYERWTASSELMCMNPGWQMKDLAEFLHLDASMVTRLLSPSQCIPAVQEALKEGKLGISDCYAISKLPEAEQAALLAMKLSGASRDAIEQAARKKRNGNAPAIRVARIKCPVAGGAVVQISGEGISLNDAIEAAQEWIKEAKKACEQGLDAKTFERVCRDKAKRG